MGTHPAAIVSEKAIIGENVSIGPFSIIYDNVVIADNSIIESHCEIGVQNHLSGGKSLILSNGTHIRSHSIFYEGSEFGENMVTGHRVTVREYTKAGKNLQIGTLSDIQGFCNIGDYVRLHSNVFIAQKSRIGNYVWLMPNVLLTNDPHPPSNEAHGVLVEDFAVIAARSVIAPGVKISKNVLIGACSYVNRDTKENMIYVGIPAKAIGKTDTIKLKDGSGRNAYPWITHFKRGYPPEVVDIWNQYSIERINE